ncbi:multiple C2 and transmembrane domain-containing protein 2 [Pholidichthys leucotaenia]
MDGKKKNLVEKLREKFQPKKSPKKPLAKQKRNLASRRSVSVPNLTLVPGEGDPNESPLFSGASPTLSDNDSVGNGLVIEAPSFTEKQNDPVSESVDHSSPLFNSKSASETLSLYEEINDIINLDSDKKVNLQEDLYAKVDKRAKLDVSKFTFTEPVPAPRHIYSNKPAFSPRQDVADRTSALYENDSTERVRSTTSSSLPRVRSLGEQINPYFQKKLSEQKKLSSGKWTPPPVRHKRNPPADRSSPLLDSLSPPLESADRTSLDSACGTSSEERVTWTDSEEQEKEPFTPMLTSELSIIESILEVEQPQPEEDAEEPSEISQEQCELFDENLPDTPAALTTGTEPQTPAPFQRYLLNINLKHGKNLEVRNKRSGKSDPYVKFKSDGKQFYKSKVVYKNLNPRWNESFSHPLRDREHNVEVRVYDKNLTADEFMGSSNICVKNLEINKTQEMELPLENPKSKDYMGVIVVDVCLQFRDATIKKANRWGPKRNKQNQAATPQRSAETQKNQLRSQTWKGVLSITLVEGQDMPQHGQGDIYVRFRLGDQKYKSKNLCIQANPQWREQFDFNQYEDNQEPLQVEVCSKRGRKAEESWGVFEADVLRLSLNERQLYTKVLNPEKGKLVFLITLKPTWGVSISDIEEATLTKSDEREAVKEKFCLKNSYKCVGDVGFLQVSVMKANDLPASDINGKSNAFCVVELGNCKLLTHTVYKTVNPEWDKAFTFPIKDINDVLVLTVLDENGDKANFLGKVAIPLLTIQNGQPICLFLKKEDLGSSLKATITLVLEVIYNKVRAGIKSFQPKEVKLMAETPKFSKKVLAQNIYRVRKISTAVLFTLQYIKSCFQWESTQRSLIAFLIFFVTVWHWEVFMLPLFLLLLLGWNYFQLSKGKGNTSQELVNMTMGDNEEEDEKEPGKKGLMDKIHMVQEVVMAVQNVLDEIANIGERIKNIFNWSVPFLSCLACLVLFVASALLYFIPLRYIVLIWGINKFTKKLRNPYSIDHNEILDFLQRVPSDFQKVQYSAVRAPTSQSQPRKKK